jgi:hypothetical protein
MNINSNKNYLQIINIKLKAIINNKNSQIQNLNLQEKKLGFLLNIPKNIALHIDYTYKNFNKKFNFDYIANYTEKIILLIRLIEEKDLFEITNRKYLCQRILQGNNNNYNDHLEIKLINKLKLENGTMFTFRSEIMLKDIKNSNSIMDNFLSSKFYKVDFKEFSRFNKIEFNYRVLTQASWLINSEENLSMNDFILLGRSNKNLDFLLNVEKFINFFKAFFKQKLLYFNLTYSSSEIYAKINKKNYHFTLSAIQALILNFFSYIKFNENFNQNQSLNNTYINNNYDNNKTDDINYNSVINCFKISEKNFNVYSNTTRNKNNYKNNKNNAVNSNAFNIYNQSFINNENNNDNENNIIYNNNNINIRKILIPNKDINININEKTEKEKEYLLKIKSSRISFAEIISFLPNINKEIIKNAILPLIKIGLIKIFLVKKPDEIFINNIYYYNNINIKYLDINWKESKISLSEILSYFLNLKIDENLYKNQYQKKQIQIKEDDLLENIIINSLGDFSLKKIFSIEFEINLNFSNKQQRLRINYPREKEIKNKFFDEKNEENPNEEKDAENEGLKIERKYQIESNIIRIMKRKKEILHQELISETLSSLQNYFVPTISAVKLRIENLIERNFISRDKNEYNKYIYQM